MSRAGFDLCMPFMPLLLRETLHISEEYRGLCVSIYTFASLTSLCIATAFWGIIGDRYGSKLMLLRASYAAAIFYPLLALAPNFYVLLAIRFICSFFSGTVNPAQTLLVSTTPPEKHGFALGTLSTATSSGDMLGFLLGGLIVEYFGYTTAFMTCGVIYLVSALLVHLFIHEDFHRTIPTKTTVKESRWQSFRRLATPGVTWLLLLFMLNGLATRNDSPFVPMLVETINGFDRAAFFTGIASAAAAFGGILSGIAIGRLSDKYSPKMLLTFVIALTATLTATHAFVPNIHSLIAIRFATRFAAGGLQPILLVVLSRITSPERKGTFFGWSGSVNQAGGIFAALLSGTVAYYVGVRGIFISSAIIFFMMLPLSIPMLKAAAIEEKALKSSK
ncbi:MAG: MFS transporter [Victivallales bacterium]|nr:MFS transporter [Victivallales bacterium]